MRVALYARVSTVDKDQNPEVQLEPMREYCRNMDWLIYREYIDFAPAGDYLHRTSWTILMKDASIRRFDTLLVWKLDRAFRLASNALNTLEMLKSYNVRFKSYTQPDLDTGTISGKMMFTIMAAVAEMEKEQISERVVAGMEYARAHGTRSGVPIGRKRHDITLQTICKAVHTTRNSDGSFNFSAAARELSEKYKKKSVGAGFVSLRLKREAAARHISRELLIIDQINQVYEEKEE